MPEQQKHHRRQHQHVRQPHEVDIMTANKAEKIMTASKAEKLRKIIADPARFEESITLLSDSTYGTNMDAAISITPASCQVFLDKSDADIHNDDVAALSQMVYAYEYPCIAIRRDGVILVANDAAITLLDTPTFRKIDGVGLSSCDGTSLKSEIDALTSPRQQARSQKLVKVHLPGKTRAVTLVMVTIDLGMKGTNYILAFIVDFVNSPGLRQQLQQDYNLTANESDVLELFVGGQTLAEIAMSRSRSITTVRKQFYTVMEKFNVSSQTELLREIFLTSNVLLMVQPMLKPAQHPHRREVNVLRSYGRSVDVTLAGDMAGEPIVVATSLFLRCFPARIEKMFKDAGLLIISIAAPCFGATSPPLHEDQQFQCHAEDIAAVLDQLSIDQATLFATDYRFPPSLITAQFIPDRVKQIVATNIALPRSYQNSPDAQMTFFDRVQHLTKSSDLMLSLIARIGARAFSVFGPGCILPLLYRNDPEIIATFREPDTFAEIDASFKSVFAQGLKPAISGFEICNTDWSHLIENCQVPIILYESSNGKIHLPETIRLFASHFDNKVEYIELDCSLSNIIYGEPDLLISMLKSEPQATIVDRASY